MLLWFGQSMNSYSNNGQGAMFFIIATVLFLLYWFTRRHVISITPDGGKAINFVVSSMSTEQIEDFVNKVQLAKVHRISQIYKL